MGRVKATKEEKINAVEKFFSGQYTMRALASEYDVHPSSIERWINLYKTFGPGGISSDSNYKAYPVKMKKEAVRYYMNSNESLLNVCKQYKIRSISMLQQWIKQYG